MLEFLRKIGRRIYKVLPGLKNLLIFFIDRFPGKFRWQLAQAAEFDFHAQDIHKLGREDQRSFDHSKKILEGFGYQETEMQNKTVIDIGAGSKLLSRFFKDAKIIAIEPLADKFLKNLPWSDLNKTYKTYSIPAEQYVSELENIADFVMCINVLDHTHSPETIMKNCYRYLKSNGTMLLSVDMHTEYTGLEHPVNFKDLNAVKTICEAVGFKVGKEYMELPQLNVKAYGLGTTYTAILSKT